jgi:hypothetical protein
MRYALLSIVNYAHRFILDPLISVAPPVSSNEHRVDVMIVCGHFSQYYMLREGLNASENSFLSPHAMFDIIFSLGVRGHRSMSNTVPFLLADSESSTVCIISWNRQGPTHAQKHDGVSSRYLQAGGGSPSSQIVYIDLWPIKKSIRISFVQADQSRNPILQSSLFNQCKTKFRLCSYVSSVFMT